MFFNTTYMNILICVHVLHIDPLHSHLFRLLQFFVFPYFTYNKINKRLLRT
jgi:hypothetical protein